MEECKGGRIKVGKLTSYSILFDNTIVQNTFVILVVLKDKDWSKKNPRRQSLLGFNYLSYFSTVTRSIG